MNVCFVKYICPESNQYRWLDESLGFAAANRLCKLLARDGRKPVLYRVFLNPEFTLQMAASFKAISSFPS